MGSKCGSLENATHKAGGGDKKVKVCLIVEKNMWKKICDSSWGKVCGQMRKEREGARREIEGFKC